VTDPDDFLVGYGQSEQEPEQQLHTGEHDAHFLQQISEVTIRPTQRLLTTLG
jgi:hypothetical protein